MEASETPCKTLDLQNPSAKYQPNTNTKLNQTNLSMTYNNSLMDSQCNKLLSKLSRCINEDLEGIEDSKLMQKDETRQGPKLEESAAGIQRIPLLTQSMNDTFGQGSKNHKDSNPTAKQLHEREELANRESLKKEKENVNRLLLDLSSRYSTNKD